MRVWLRAFKGDNLLQTKLCYFSNRFPNHDNLKINASICLVAATLASTSLAWNLSNSSEKSNGNDAYKKLDQKTKPRNTVLIEKDFLPIAKIGGIAFCENDRINDANKKNETLNSPNHSTHHHHQQEQRSPSQMRFLLSRLRLRSLPIPRLLTRNDPVFTYPELKRGLLNRMKDEKELIQLTNEAIEAKVSGDVKKIARVTHKISEVAYGKGVTPNMRQDFLIVSYDF